MNEILFIVPGHPVAKGRPKAARRGKSLTMYTPSKTVNYEGLIAHSAQIAMAGRELIQGAVSVELDIRLQIPDSWSGKKKKLAQDGLLFPTKKPDIDNIFKACADGMNGVVYMDDVQIVQTSQKKRYALTPGVVVIVRELDLENA
ncbi:MAG: RusA family crossover junction endodeoxyribonuclease [Nitrosomonas sp.]|uniref:RusA family crossover junction endodeoxyribonuclease n=1 Tax=Nitrosomonas sp. TaxID=42353 RepID=UPI0025FD7C8D|nr:RusA family crossover junction endodeoxyribonuclease [Nitrosomonas sp.]MBY0475433.1 RusA family crossover junction endodeoxyribonuclease [Nitrosomonas sp.]